MLVCKFKTIYAKHKTHVNNSRCNYIVRNRENKNGEKLIHDQLIHKCVILPKINVSANILIAFKNTISLSADILIASADILIVITTAFIAQNRSVF